MKSLNFTHSRDKLVIGTKTQTIRCLYFPTFEENEIIMITFNKIPLFQAKITKIYCKKIKDLNDKEAKLDGFDNKKQLIHAIIEINNLKSSNRFCAVIRFKRISKSIEDFMKPIKNLSRMRNHSI